MPRTTPGTFYVWSHQLLSTTLRARCHHSERKMSRVRFRVGKWSAFSHWNIRPSLTSLPWSSTLARALGSSYQSPYPLLTTTSRFPNPCLCSHSPLSLESHFPASIHSSKPLLNIPFPEHLPETLAVSHFSLSHIHHSICQSLPDGRPRPPQALCMLCIAYPMFKRLKKNNCQYLRIESTQKFYIPSGHDPPPPSLLGNNYS